MTFQGGNDGTVMVCNSNFQHIRIFKKIFFVKIKSMQFGFLDWKNVGFLIKHSKPNDFIKTSKVLALNSHVEIANRHKVFILTG